MLRKKIQRADWNPWLANVQLSKNANITLPAQYTYSLLNKHNYITTALFMATHMHTYQVSVAHPDLQVHASGGPTPQMLLFMK